MCINEHLTMIRVALLAVAIVALVVVLPNALPAEVHDHADFAVYLHGNLYDFSKEQYMREDREPRIHFHDLNGRIVHVHARGVTLGMLFAGMNMTLTDRCLNLDNGTAYCTDERHRLTLSVNGRINNAFAEATLPPCRMTRASTQRRALSAAHHRRKKAASGTSARLKNNYS